MQQQDKNSFNLSCHEPFLKYSVLGILLLILIPLVQSTPQQVKCYSDNNITCSKNIILRDVPTCTYNEYDCFLLLSCKGTPKVVNPFLDPLYNLNVTDGCTNVTLFQTVRFNEEGSLLYPIFVTPSELTSTPSLKRSDLDLIYNVTFSSPFVRVRTSDSSPKILVFSVREITRSYIISGENDDIELSPSLLVSNAILNTYLISDGSLVNKGVFVIDKRDACLIEDCGFICKEYFTHFHCYSTMTKAFIIVAFICTGLLVIAIISLIIYYLTKHLKLKLNSQPSDTSSDESFELKTVLNEEEFPPETRAIPRRQRPKLNVAMLVLLIFAIGANAECITSTVISSELVKCIPRADPSLNDCTLKVNTQFILPTIGSSLCLDFFDKESSTWVASVQVILDSIRYRANIDFQYYTADWHLDSFSKKFCSTTSPSCSGNKCLEVNSNDVTFFDYAWNLNQPGVTQCRSSCGCAGCYCLVCSDACLYSRYSFRPVSEPYEVFSVEEITVEPTIKIIVNYNGTQSEDLFNLKYVQADFRGFQILNMGDLTRPFLGVGDLGLIHNTTHKFLSNFSPLGAPTFGLPGDIQTNAAVYLKEQPNFFAFPVSGVDFIETPGAINYRAPMSGAKSLDYNGKSLPYNSKGIIWDLTSDGLIGIPEFVDPVLIYLSSDGTLRFTVNSTDVCPSVTLVKVNGCYSCLNGFSISIEIVSTCSIGTVQVIYPNSFYCAQTGVFFNTTLAPYTLACKSNEKNVIGAIKFISSTGKTSEIYINSALEAPPPIEQQYYQNSTSGYNTQIANLTHTVGYLEDLFNSFSLGNPFKILLSFGVSLLALVILICLLCMLPEIIGCIKRCKPSSYEKVE